MALYVKATFKRENSKAHCFFLWWALFSVCCWAYSPDQLLQRRCGILHHSSERGGELLCTTYSFIKHEDSQVYTLVLSTVLLGGNDKSLTDGSTRRSLAPVGGALYTHHEGCPLVGHEHGGSVLLSWGLPRVVCWEALPLWDSVHHLVFTLGWQLQKGVAL